MTQSAPGGTFTLGGNPGDLGGLPVHRLGFGAMRITGGGVWGEPADREEALAVLRRAIELGVTLIDTADSYGSNVSEELIREALHPYPEDLVIATKAGLARTGPGGWVPVGRPAYLRQQVELSLRKLAVDRIDLLQLHRIDRDVPVADQVGELKSMQDEGKIRHIGLSEVTVPQIEEASKTATIVSVQNHFNLADREHAGVLDYASEHGIGFIPFFPIATGKLASPGSVLEQASKAHNAAPGQLALAWLLQRSPAMLPIPGTSKVAHLEENMAAAEITLTSDEFKRLEELAS